MHEITVEAASTNRKPVTRSRYTPNPSGLSPAGLSRPIAEALRAADSIEATCTVFARTASDQIPHERLLIFECPADGPLTTVFDSKPGPLPGLAIDLAASSFRRGSSAARRLPETDDRASHEGTSLAIPAVLGRGPAMAVVFVSTPGGRGVRSRATALVEEFAPYLSQAVLADRLAASGRRQSVLLKVAGLLAGAEHLDDAFEQLADEIQSLVPFDRLVVEVVDPAAETFMIGYVSGIYIAGQEPGESFPLEGSPCARIVASRKGQILDGSRVNGHPTVAAEVASGVRSSMVVPLIFKNAVIGVLRFGARRENAYSPADLPSAEQVAATIASTVANADLYRQSARFAEERELRARLDSENRELIRIDQLKRRFFSLVSHELKTPLTTMVAFADVLAQNRDHNLTPRQLTQVQLMQRSGRRLNMLVEDLFDLARIETGGFRLMRRECDVKRLIEDQIAGFDPILALKKQTLNARIPDQEVWMDADPDRISQIVANLLSNASKYSPDGSAVELELRVDGDRLHVVVEDHGHGISAIDQRNLFTAFFRADTEETRSTPGTGLGLYITKTLVELHGGQITLESEVGRGTRISLFVRGVLTRGRSSSPA